MRAPYDNMRSYDSLLAFSPSGNTVAIFTDGWLHFLSWQSYDYLKHRFEFLSAYP
jgi:hypothetical protein